MLSSISLTKSGIIAMLRMPASRQNEVESGVGLRSACNKDKPAAIQRDGHLGPTSAQHFVGRRDFWPDPHLPAVFA